MKKKTALQLMEEHKKYENSFVKQSGAGTVTYERSGRSHTYCAMSWRVKNHLVKTLEKIKELHFEEFKDTGFDARRLEQLTKLIESDAPSPELNSIQHQNLNPVILDYNIKYTLIHGEQTLATGLVMVSNTKDKSKDLRRVLDTVYLSLRSKGINRLFWFRAVSFQLSHLPEVTLNSRSGVTLNIKVGTVGY